jgi:cysteine protease ATG4
MYKIYAAAAGAYGIFNRFYDNTVNYFYANREAVTADGSPIYMIGGIEYKATTAEEASIKSSALRAQLDSLPWLSYRRNIEGTHLRSSPKGFTSDSGWGCTLRSTQMLTAATLMEAQLGSDFRRGSLASLEQNQTFVDIVSLFADNSQAPLSIVKLVDLGIERKSVKGPGEWFGPGSAAYYMSRLASEAQLSVPIMYFVDRVVYRKDVLTALKQRGLGVLVLVPTQLGSSRSADVERVKQPLIDLFKNPLFRGFIGGDSVSQSYFFAGASQDYMFILDPHTTQPAVPSNIANIDVAVPAQPGIVTMRWSRLGSSLSLGFLIKTVADFDNMKTYLKENNRGNQLGIAFA